MNREFRARLRNMRDVAANMAVELSEMLGEFPEKILPDEKQDDFHTADEEEQKLQEGQLWIKDLNEATILKDQVITGEVLAISQVTNFNRKDGTEGAVRNVLIGDPTGQILVVFWDKDINQLASLNKGQYLRITNAWQVKRNKTGKLELHPGKFAKVEVVE